MSDSAKQPAKGLGELLEGLPKNWGKWGPNDELGSLNYLTPEQVVRGVATIRSGKTFTLQVQIGNPKGDPLWPGRRSSHRVNVLDRSHFACGRHPHIPGDMEYVDDMMIMYLQGSTQYDALGHAWYDGQIWNGYSADTTIGGTTKASVLPIAEKGVVGRGVLIDMARHRNKPHLGRGESFTHIDLMEAAKKQGVEIRKRDILVVRTGWIGSFYDRESTEFYKDFNEPGLIFSRELVEWFHEMEIPNLITDTISNEVTFDPGTGFFITLHGALMRNLGVAFTEIAFPDALAEDCAADGQWDFLYVAAPLKVVDGSGAPVNPICIK